MPNNSIKKDTFIFILIAALSIIIDQSTKWYSVYHWDFPNWWYVFGNDFLMLVSDRNKGVIFGIAHDWYDTYRIAIVNIIPIIIIFFLVYWYFRDARRYHWTIKYSIPLIFGGGIGNMIDRLFYKEGVIDWISFKLYGLFGLSRFPTFNIADSSAFIGIFGIIVYSLFFEKKDKKGKRR